MTNSPQSTSQTAASTPIEATTGTLFVAVLILRLVALYSTQNQDIDADQPD
jgi:hypothetical protein